MRKRLESPRLLPTLIAIALMVPAALAPDPRTSTAEWARSESA